MVTYLFGFRYFVAFIDDFSRGTWVYLLKSKQDVLSVFQQFHKMIDTQFNARVKILCTNNGGSTLLIPSLFISLIMEFFTKPPVQLHLNKMRKLKA